MATHRGRPVEAEQWRPGVKIEGVREVPVTVHFSVCGKLYYVSGDRVQPRMWLPVEPGACEVKPFAFWDVKQGREEPITTDDPLYVRAAEAEGWAELAIPYGLLDLSERNRKVVYASNWVVSLPGGERVVMTDAEFIARYESA